MEKVTYSKLRHWMETDSLYSMGGFKLSAWSGYYHIYLEGENGSCLGMIITAKTPREAWDSWNIFKSGIRFARTGRV